LVERVPVVEGLHVPGLEVVERLGGGSHGAVYRVRRGGAEYALKLLDRSVVDGAEAGTAFRREAALLGGLPPHPTLVGVHEVGQVGGRPYLVMDLAQGRSMAQVLVSAGPVGEDAATRIGLDVAAALGVLHRAGLVHRDIKPANVVLAPDGAARLIDFGLIAAAAAKSDVDGLTVGTPAYAAPEQAGTLARPVDGRSDLYALGAVLYECLTGAPPFESDDAGQLLRLHATTPAPDPRVLAPEVSGGMAAVLSVLLAKDPDDRYASADALIADLRRLRRERRAAGGIAAEFVPRPYPTAPPAPARRLVGRAAELGTLAEHWRRAAGGAGSAVLVRGPAGIGKSRLVDELAAQATAAGGTVLRGACTPDSPLPLAAFRAAVTDHIRALDTLPEPARTAGQARVRAAAAGTGVPAAAIAPELGRLVGGPGPGEDRDPADPGHVRLALAALLTGIARGGRGTLLLVEDVQWLDAAGRRVLGELAADLPQVPLLVVLTGRDDARAAATAGAARALGPALAADLTLAPLEPAELLDLLADMLPGLDRGSRLAALLAARANGSPLVALEYLRGIVEAGLLRPHWGGWELDEAAVDRLDLTGRAADLMLSRIRDLGTGTRALLTMAAAAGERIEPAVIAAACEAEPGAVRDALALAAGRGLVEAREGGGYAFVNHNIRGGLLAAAGETGAAALHQRLAEVLDDGRTDPEHVYALADHYRRGIRDASPARAYRACVAAGRLALDQQAPGQAVPFLDHAAALPGPHDAEFLALHGTALQLDGQYPAALARLKDALIGTTDRTARARLRSRIADVCLATWDVATGLTAVDEGFRELRVRVPRGRLGLAVSSLWLFCVALLVGWTRIGYGSVRGEKRARFEVAVDLHRAWAYLATLDLGVERLLLCQLRALYYLNRLGPGRLYAEGLSAVCALVGVITSPALVARPLRRARRIADDLGDLRASVTVATAPPLVYFVLGKDDGTELRRMAEQHQQALDLGHFSNLATALSWSAITEGRTAEARVWVDRCLRRLAAVGDSEVTGLATSAANLYAMTGRFTEAAAELRSLRELAAGGGRPGLTVLVSEAEILTAREQTDYGPDFEAAVETFLALSASPVRTPPPFRATFAHIALARLDQCRAARAGGGPDVSARLDAARAMVRLVRRGAATPALRAWHRIAAADLALLDRDPDKAAALLDKVRPLRPDAPALAYEAARVRARLWAARGDTGESERCARYALGIAHAQGWPHRSRWIAAEFAVTDAGTRAVRMGSGSAPGREIERQRLRAVEEVSQLAAQTLDTRELARSTLDATVRILSADRAYLFLVDDDGTLTAYLGRDAAGADIPELTGYSASLVERVRASGELVVVTGTDEGVALGAQSVLLHGLRSIMVAPMLLGDRLRGVLYLDSQVAKGIFTADDAGILAALTNQIATALETVRAAELERTVVAAHQQQKLAEALLGALRAMSATLEPDGVLGSLVDSAARLLPCDRAWLVLTGEPAGAAGPGGAGPGGTVRMRPAGGGPEQVVAATPAALPLLAATSAVTGAGEPHALGDLGPTGSWAALPMTTRTGRLGLLLLAADAPDCYQQPELALGATLVAAGMSAYENASLFAEVQRLAVMDELTGVANRRAFFDRAERDVDRPQAMIMLDIDHFKRINDLYGHPTGDDVIKVVAQRLAAAVRRADVLGRYGGEEFAILLADGGDDAAEVAERLRAAVGGTPVPTRSGPLPVTVSVGLAEYGAERASINALVAAADTALYQAKSDGRNRVRAA
jgi:eukaryotic-like serine/threonine-protein kinase